ncbi:MAG TPA: hypothetical protein PKJ24_00320, partial [Prolixibacteraceae bacterium]|nr:hypothetical protein [Prolixibacteraceae bacterium]
MAPYKRILLKLSGESLMGEQQYGIDPARLQDYAEDIKNILQEGVEVAVVIGGGNIFRGIREPVRASTGSPGIRWGCWLPLSTA